MRVISGTARGRRLFASAGLKTRPTSDRVKESLFNILGERVRGAVVLDLYAGTGALAIEALSRGADRAVLVETDRRALEAVERNLGATGFTDKAVIRRQPAGEAVADMATRGELFDLIFLDPPYKIRKVELEAVLRSAMDCLTGRGLAVLEHASNLSELKVDERTETIDTRRYGDTRLTFFEERKK